MKKMKKKDAFEALIITRARLAKLIPVTTIKLSFRLTDDGRKVVSLLVFYQLNGDESNFTIDAYEHNSNLSIEELESMAVAQITSLNPKQVTQVII